MAKPTIESARPVKIFKLVTQLTIFLAADSMEAAQNELNSCNLATVAFEVDEGEWLGGPLQVISLEEIAVQNVGDELRSIGNDGTFFDAELGEG